MFGFGAKKDSQKKSAETASKKTMRSVEDNSHDFDFIVIKQIDSRPLYASRSQPHDHHQHRHHSSVSPSAWSDSIATESALAFGGQRRKKSKSSTAEMRSERLSSMEISRPSSRNSLRSSKSPRPDSRIGSVSSTESEADAAWREFREKYEPSGVVEVQPRTIGGRYGAGRGYIEYQHRRSCSGNCEGACFGK